MSKVLASVQTRIARPATLQASTVIATIRADYERRVAELPQRDAYGRNTTFGALLALLTMAGTLAMAASTVESYDAFVALRDEIDAAIQREFCVGGQQ